MTPKTFLGRGAFEQRKSSHGGEFDQKKIKNVKCPGVSPGGDGGGGWAPFDLTHTLIRGSSCDLSTNLLLQLLFISNILATCTHVRTFLTYSSNDRNQILRQHLSIMCQDIIIVESKITPIFLACEDG